jgi:hypothetical protein
MEQPTQSRANISGNSKVQTICTFLVTVATCAGVYFAFLQHDKIAHHLYTETKDRGKTFIFSDYVTNTGNRSIWIRDVTIQVKIPENDDVTPELKWFPFVELTSKNNSTPIEAGAARKYVSVSVTRDQLIRAAELGGIVRATTQRGGVFDKGGLSPLLKQMVTDTQGRIMTNVDWELDDDSASGLRWHDN